jgi:hypothetical protein
MLKLTTSVLVVAAAAVAQSTANIPNPAVFPGGGSSGNIWRAGLNRVQCLYDSTNWTGQGITLPVLINQLEWRNLAAVAAPITYPSVDIHIQPAAVDFATPSTTFATNRSAPLGTPAYSGPVTVQAAATNGTYVINIPLTTPVTYDPTAGADLLVEIVINAAPTPLTGTTIDCGFSNPAHLCNSVRSVGSTTALGGTASAFCPVLRTTYGPVPGAAGIQSLGAGCIAKYASFYEEFATPAGFDLANSAVTFLPSAGGYIVVQSGGFLPVGSTQSPATALALGDDAEVTQTLTTGSFTGPNGAWPALTIGSNGVISELPSHPASAAGGGAPGPATFLNAAQTAFYNLGDWDPSVATGGGNVWYEESASVITVTWENVPNWVQTLPAPGVNTFQFQLYPSGIVTIAWNSTGLTSFGNNGGARIGFSPGGANLDPASADISALSGSNSTLLVPVDVAPMALAAGNRPVFGTNWNLTSSNIDPTSVLGVEVFGLTDPGINDLFFLGMPGCGLRASLDVVNAFLVTGSTYSYSLPIPAGQPTLLGLDLFTTSATAQSPAQNAFGWMTSNGIKGTLGSI